MHSVCREVAGLMASWSHCLTRLVLGVDLMQPFRSVPMQRGLVLQAGDGSSHRVL